MCINTYFGLARIKALVGKVTLLGMYLLRLIMLCGESFVPSCCLVTKVMLIKSVDQENRLLLDLSRKRYCGDW